MGFNEYLKGSGVLDCARDVHECRRLKDLGTALYRLIGNHRKESFSISEIELKSIKQVILFCQKLFSLDLRASEHIPHAVTRGLANVLFKGLIDVKEIVFVSFASNALTIDGKLREKKQYELPDKIFTSLKEVTELSKFPTPTAGDPTYAEFNGVWYMYYGEHPNINYATASN